MTKSLMIGILLFASPPSFSGENLESKVPIEEAQKVCASKNDCAKIEQTDCSQCCQEGAINKKFFAKYSESFKKTCENYAGPSCDCSPSSKRPVCREGRCAL